MARAKQFVRDWPASIAIIIIGLVGISTVYVAGRRADNRIDARARLACRQALIVYDNQQLVLEAIDGIFANIAERAYDPRNKALAARLRPRLHKSLITVRQTPPTCK